jgi:uncharacterized protein YqeY
MSLKERLAADLRDAMRAGDEQRKTTIRLTMASIRNAEIASGHELDDRGVEEVLRKEVKQRRDSIEEFTRGGRNDLVERETEELEVLRGYLPQLMSREEISVEARVVIAEVGATDPRDKGKVMGPLLQRLAGRAEGRDVNEVVTGLLSG